MLTLRKLFGRARAMVYRIPVVGHGLRYLKRLVLMPWNFHKMLEAWSNEPPAGAARVAAFDAANATQAMVFSTANAVQSGIVESVVVLTDRSAAVACQATYSAAHAINTHVTNSVLQVQGAVQQVQGTIQSVMTNNLKGELKTAFTAMTSDIGRCMSMVTQDVTAELSKLNETHAQCYDRIVEVVRQLSLDLQGLKTKDVAVDELTARVQALTERLDELDPPTVNGPTNGNGTHRLRRVG